ncbi:hypothetical protein LCGC14_1368930 [marine sediment metagenome]|uniref:Squalene cyclase C-terminal domain-containing protein n=1 Tax=marine sediment metagenome TaxID=412755 RepID=A0A0F9N7X1_9ZZZZ
MRQVKYIWIDEENNRLVFQAQGAGAILGITLGAVGKAGGIAGLNSHGDVEVSQLPAALVAAAAGGRFLPGALPLRLGRVSVTGELAVASGFTFVDQTFVNLEGVASLEAAGVTVEYGDDAGDLVLHIWKPTSSINSTPIPADSPRWVQWGTIGISPTNREKLAMGHGAHRIFRTQKNDGGWQWMNPDTDPTQIPSPKNTLGVTAQGLLDPYCCLKLNHLLDACLACYDGMVTNSQDPSPSVHRIRGPDIPFLVEFSTETGISTYGAFARTRWEAAKTEYGGGTATGLAEFIRDIRLGQGLPAIVAWDVGLYIRGALALGGRTSDDVGYIDEAREMAEVVYDSLYVAPVDFDMTDLNQAEYWLGLTGALEAFATCGVHADRADELLNSLLAGQQSDGHWAGILGGSDVQTTAYALLAILRARAQGVFVAARDAESRAVQYLLSSQSGNGGWAYDGTENTEVSSEAIQALSLYHLNGDS